MMQKYAEKMPRSKGKKASVLAVNGAMYMDGRLEKGYSGQALEQIEKILRQKKYEVCLTSNASFPHNWTQVVNPCSSLECGVIIPLGEAEVREFAGDFLSGKKKFYRCGFFNTLWSSALSWLFGTLGRRALGKFFIADDNCTNCGICAATCPARTIKMRGKKPS
jgi:NAD-dependent dihydropyrimidine dehydrogenase PreA subunit